MSHGSQLLRKRLLLSLEAHPHLHLAAAGPCPRALARHEKAASGSNDDPFCHLDVDLWRSEMH